MDLLYRIMERNYWDDEAHTQVVIALFKYQSVRRTPKGQWIVPLGAAEDEGVREKFILNGRGKRFAYPTVELALQSYLIRKRRQVQHLEQKLALVQSALAQASAPDFCKESMVGIHHFTNGPSDRYRYVSFTGLHPAYPGQVPL